MHLRKLAANLLCSSTVRWLVAFMRQVLLILMLKVCLRLKVIILVPNSIVIGVRPKTYLHYIGVSLIIISHHLPVSDQHLWRTIFFIGVDVGSLASHISKRRTLRSWTIVAALKSERRP